MKFFRVKFIAYSSILCRYRYSLNWLDFSTKAKPIHHNPATVQRIYWDSSLSTKYPPTVDYSRLLDEERLSSGTMEKSERGGDRRPVLKQLLDNLLCYGFAFVDNTPTNLEATMSATAVVSFPQVEILYQPTTTTTTTTNTALPVKKSHYTLRLRYGRDYTCLLVCQLVCFC